MTDDQLKYADKCIAKLHEHSPNFLDDRKTMLKREEIIAVLNILKDEGFIEKSGDSLNFYKLKESAYSILDTHKSYSAYHIYNLEEEDIQKQKEQLETEVLNFQKDNFEYSKTIRGQEETIRILEIKLKRIELFKQYWWLLGIILGVGITIGTYLGVIILK